jgi:hypothetical protein
VRLHCIDSSLQQHCTATSNKVPPRLACLIQGIMAHRLTSSTVPPLGTYWTSCVFVCSSSFFWVLTWTLAHALLSLDHS